MKKIIILMFIPFVLFCSELDSKNSDIKKASKIEDKLMDEEFKTIIRFNPLYLKEQKLKESSKKELENMVKTIKQYEKSENELIVTVIGFTRAQETNNEKVIRESTFSYKDLFYGFFEDKSYKSSGVDNAVFIAKELVDAGVKKDVIIVESTKRDEKHFTEGIDRGKELNHSVMVSLYETNQ